MRSLSVWLVGACLFSGSVSAAEVVRAAYEDKPLPPFYMGSGADPDPVAPGVSVELLREAAAAAGIEIQFVRIPWARCLKSLKSGEIDAIFNASFKEERQEAGVYPMAAGKPDGSRRIANLSYVLYRLKDGPVTWDGKAVGGLDGSPVGIQAGYSVSEDVARLGLKPEESADTITIFKKLASRRIAVVAQLEASGDAALARGDFPAIEKMQPPLVTKDYFLMFSHQFYDSRRATAEKLWAKLAEVREHRAAAITAKYLQ